MTKKKQKCSIPILAQSFPKRTDYDPPDKCEMQGEGTRLQLEIDKQIVKEYLITLNDFKSPEPDELHSRVLKELAKELSELLSIIFLKSWETGEVPEDWRRANIVPIFKKGKK